MRAYLGKNEIQFIAAETAVNMGVCVTDGEYDKNTNKVATQQTVNGGVQNAKVELEGKIESAKAEAQTALVEHNTSETAHGDLRVLITELTTRLNALADSEDVELDQLSELVAFIKANKEDIAELTTDKVKYTDIVNDLETNVENKVLSAAQGVALKALIDGIPALLGLTGEALGNPATPIYWNGTKFAVGTTKTVEEMSWEWLSQCSDRIAAGEDPETFGLKVGMKKIVTLSTGENVDFVILGFNHDELASGSGKAGITFGMPHLLATVYDIFDVAPTTYNGDIGDTMIPHVLAEIYGTLPSDLTAYIKSVNKKGGVVSTYNGDRVYSESSKIFLFSAVELGVEEQIEGCGNKYDYYTKLSGSSCPVKSLSGAGTYGYVVREIKQVSSASSNSYFTLRKMDANGLSSSANPAAGGTYNKTGICFGFCI